MLRINRLDYIEIRRITLEHIGAAALGTNRSDAAALYHCNTLFIIQLLYVIMSNKTGQRGIFYA